MISLCVALALCLFGSERASFALSPGIRAAQITLYLDDPAPFTPQPKAQGHYPLGNGLPAAQGDPAAAMPLSIPSAFDTGAAAAPFVMPSLSPQDFWRAEQCLTAALYYEAASESEAGQRAVAQVVLNRVRHPAWPKTICGVVYQGSDRPGCQFSYACDGAMQRRPDPRIWAQVAQLAREALSGRVYAPVGMATHYHTLQVNPVWNRHFIITAVLGNHIFYRLPGEQSAPHRFKMAYAGAEPYPAPLPWRGPAIERAAPNQAAPTDLAARATASKRVLAEADIYIPGALPQSEVLPQFRQSGSWLDR